MPDDPSLWMTLDIDREYALEDWSPCVRVEPCGDCGKMGICSECAASIAETIRRARNDGSGEVKP